MLEKEKIVDPSDRERVGREISILKTIRQENVIQLYEIIESQQCIYLVMEYANGGELFEYIVKHERISEQESAKFLLQLLDGIEYLHRLGIVHRDLKPENLLLDSSNNLKIVDFGLSNQYDASNNEYLQTACGSPCYAAPEMIQGQKYNALMVDLWSTGIILFALVCGYLPFDDQNTTNLYKKIIHGKFLLPDFLTKDCKSLIKGILKTDPAKRFTI